MAPAFSFVRRIRDEIGPSSNVMAHHDAQNDLILHNPLWQPVWGLRFDARALHSPAMAFVLMLAVLMGIHWLSQFWIQGLWSQETPATTWQRGCYGLLMTWRHWGPVVCLLCFAFTLLWTTSRKGIMQSLISPSLQHNHLIIAALLPAAAVWGMLEMTKWVEAFRLAHEMAMPGEGMIWLIRRPGEITFLTDPGPPLIVAICHNFLTMGIALLGYGIFLLWWSYVIVSLVSLRRSFLTGLFGLIAIGGAVVMLDAIVARLQGMIPLFHPLSLWMIPPGTSAYALWRFELVTPLQHFYLYASMHFSLLILEMGVLGVLIKLNERAGDRLKQMMA